jgi:AcrR family transcriptional regulator
MERQSRITRSSTPKTSTEPKRGRGRPAAFDRRTALREAMKLFWQRGYEGTSFDDLIAAMSISASSFYNSFGSKERLYNEAVDQYVSETSTWFGRSLSEPGSPGAADVKEHFTAPPDVVDRLAEGGKRIRRCDGHSDRA